MITIQLTFVTLFFFSVIQVANKNSAKFLFFVSIIALFLLSAFRFEVGGDWNTYLDVMRRIASGERHFKYEPLFYYLNKFSLLFPNSYLTLNLIISLFFWLIVFFGISNYLLSFESKLYLLFFAFPLGVVFLHWGFFRQSIACIIFLLSINLLSSDRWKSVIVLSIFAILFHSSAIIPFFFLAVYKISKLDNIKLRNFLISGAFITCLLMGAYLLFFTAKKQYIGGYISKGIYIRALYLSCLLLCLLFIDKLKYFKLFISCILLIWISTFVSVMINITTITDRLFYYLVFPFSFYISSQLSKYSSQKKYAVLIFHFIYSYLFIYVWLTYSEYAKMWKVFKFWFY